MEHLRTLVIPVLLHQWTGCVCRPSRYVSEIPLWWFPSPIPSPGFYKACIFCSPILHRLLIPTHHTLRFGSRCLLNRMLMPLSSRRQMSKNSMPLLRYLTLHRKQCRTIPCLHCCTQWVQRYSYSSLCFLSPFQIALMAYDILLRLPDEVKYIWHKRPRLGIILYFLAQYPQLVLCLGQLIHFPTIKVRDYI